VFPRRRNHPDPELKALVERVVEASIRHGKTAPDIAVAYVSLNPLEDTSRGRAQQLVERIAADWRQAELAGATEATVIEDLGSADVVDLLAAIQDSLILALGEPNDQGSIPILSVDEATARTHALANGDRQTQERTDLADKDVGRFDELADRTIAALADVSTIYRELAPDGRELPEHEAESTRRALERAAILGRDLDYNRDFAAALARRRDLRPSLGILRTMQQGLVLALSANPQHRAQAIAVPELLERIRPVGEGWKVSTEESDG
jgi:hypothetical protein